MKNISPVVLFLILCSVSYGQVINPKIHITNSIGIGLKETKPVFSAGISFQAADNFFLGIKAGIYSYEENMYQVVFDNINSTYPQYSPGNYMIEYYGPYIDVQKPTYIAAFTGTYGVSDKISINASLGLKYYVSHIYDYLRVQYSKPSANHILSKSDIIIYTNGDRLLKRDVLRPYFSTGINFRINSFSAGIYADNIISMGINFGKDL